MALTLAIVNPASPVLAGQVAHFVVTVTNTGASAVTLQSLAISETTESDAQIAQPEYLIPNVPVGVGNPVLAALTGTASYGFRVVFSSPYSVGPSPQNPGGAAPDARAQSPDAIFTLQAQSLSSDGTVAAASAQVTALATIGLTQSAIGGALQMSAGFNLINLRQLGIL